MLVIRNYVCCCAGMGVVRAGSIVQHSTVQYSKVKYYGSTVHNNLSFDSEVGGWRLEVTNNYCIVLHNNYCKSASTGWYIILRQHAPDQS